MPDPDATCIFCDCAVSDHTPDGGCNGCGSTSCLCWACDSCPCRCDQDYEIGAGK